MWGFFEHSHIRNDGVDRAGRSQRERAAPDDLGRSIFGQVLSSHDNFFGTRNQIHRATRPGEQFARQVPVCQVTQFVHLQRAEDGRVKMTSADDIKRGNTVKSKAARQAGDVGGTSVNQVFILFSWGGFRAAAQQAIFGLDENGHPSR